MNNESCNKAMVSPQFQPPTFYRFSGGSWVSQGLPPAAIDAKVAWDYQTTLPGDAESGIWELEIGIDLTAGGLESAHLRGRRRDQCGSQAYVNESLGGAGATIVYRWPTGLTTDDNPSHVNPNQGAVTVATLEPLNIGGSCGEDVKIDSISGTDAKGAAGHFTRYQHSDFDASGNLPSGKRNKFTAQVSFGNPGGGPIISVLPNNGQVSFEIRPWNGGFLGTYPMGTANVTFNRLNDMALSVPLEWPLNEAQYNVAKADLNASGHTCLFVHLNGFNVNSNPANDNAGPQNLTYTTLSTVRDSFLVSARGLEKSSSGPIEYVLRPRWRNVPSGAISPKPKKGFWSYRFLTAKQLKLKDLGKGYYSMLLYPGQERRVDIELTGGKMPAQVSHWTLSPQAGGVLLSPAGGQPPLEIPVKEGQIMTIIAQGLISVDPQRFPPNGPNGFALREPERGFLLSSSNFVAASQAVGAVIGSFDKFRTAFVVGSDTTFAVPAKATRLFLAINDQAGAYTNNTGQGFTINLVVSDPVFVPTRLASLPNQVPGAPARLRAGSNLPELDIDVMMLDRKLRQLRPTGYVAYGIYDSHP